MAEAQFHNHRGGQTALEALNRVTRKVLTKNGITSPPDISRSNCVVHLVARSPEQLAATVRYHERAKAIPDSAGPPTLLAYGGHEYVIDGHNRINHHLLSGSSDPKDVLLITFDAPS